MLNFRQKIFLTYLIVFLLFIILMSPLSSLIVQRVVQKAMENRAYEIIAKVQTAPNNEVMIRRLKELKPLIFFRVSVINNERKVLYDSHTKRLLGPRFSSEQVVNHPEVIQAFETGKGHAEDYSDILAQKFAYTAVAFDFHGKTYVIRTAFPFRYVRELTNDFEVGFLFFAISTLILFSLMTWFIIHYLTAPIQRIISAVSTYKEGRYNPLTELEQVIAAVGSGEDVGQLAQTLMSLSDRVQKQITTLRDERNEKEVLLESLVEGVIATDRSLNITFANLAAQKFLGMDKEDLEGRPFKDIGQEKAYQLLLESQREGRAMTDAVKIDTDKQSYFLNVVAVPKRDNTGAILVMLDKSEHYRILEMRKDFIANASHELKTPITIIRGFAETLHDNPDLEKSMTLEITDKIVRNCERMATLVKDLLALADMENIPRSRIHEFDLIPLLEQIKKTVLEVFPNAVIQIKSPREEFLMEGDVDLMEMALMNLIQNAVQYSKAPAEVTITLSEKDQDVFIEIADMGIGIPKEALSKIFERFYRADKGPFNKVEGSGLGLSIVDTVIRKHFGKISVASEAGVGTTFTIQLPRTQ
jgi:two-component system phosphate regulon sensor histidine kinase PhoR